jgi:hypothetical protein
MSLEEYLRWYWKPDAEFVDGIVEYRMHGEKAHSAWQTALVTLVHRSGGCLEYPGLDIATRTSVFNQGARA